MRSLRWELVVIARKFLIVFIVIFSSEPTTQALLAMGVIVVALVLHVYTLAYSNSYHNRLELLLLFTNLIILFGGPLPVCLSACLLDVFQGRGGCGAPLRHALLPPCHPCAYPCPLMMLYPLTPRHAPTFPLLFIPRCPLRSLSPSPSPPPPPNSGFLLHVNKFNFEATKNMLYYLIGALLVTSLMSVAGVVLLELRRRYTDFTKHRKLAEKDLSVALLSETDHQVLELSKQIFRKPFSDVWLWRTLVTCACARVRARVCIVCVLCVYCVCVCVHVCTCVYCVRVGWGGLLFPLSIVGGNFPLTLLRIGIHSPPPPKKNIHLSCPSPIFDRTCDCG